MTHRPALLATSFALLVFSTVGNAQSVVQQRDLVSSLRAADMSTRMDAFERLRRTRGGLDSPGIGSALLEVLERENALIAETFKASNGTIGVVDKYGEGYGEYFNDLAIECAARCIPRTKRVVLALAEAFPAGSDVTNELVVDHGPELLPVFLEKVRNGGPDAKRNAVGIIGSIALLSRTVSAAERETCDSLLFARLADPAGTMDSWAAAKVLGTLVLHGSDVSAGRRAAIHAAVVVGASHPYTYARMAAISDLQAFHDARDAALLDEIAARDSFTTMKAGVVRYPIREAAAKAAGIIRQP
jgi:hypothetical protein